MKIIHLKKPKTRIYNSYLIRQSFLGYRCKSDIAIFALEGDEIILKVLDFKSDPCFTKKCGNNVAFLTLQVFISVIFSIVSFKQEMRESPLQKTQK